MSDMKLSALNPIINVTGNELVYLVIGGNQYQGTVDQLTGGVKRVRVDVSAVELLAMADTPVELVPAPGAGSMIDIVSCRALFSFGTRPYHSSTSGQGPFVMVGGLIALPNGELISGQTSNWTGVLLPGDGDPDSAENEPAQLFGYANPIAVGGLAHATLLEGGSDYAPGDTGMFSDGNGDATYTVLTVGGGGEVLTFSITSPGSGYEASPYYPTATTGVGFGFGVQVDTLSSPVYGDGTTIIDLLYRIIELP